MGGGGYRVAVCDKNLVTHRGGGWGAGQYCVTVTGLEDDMLTKVLKFQK